MLPGFRFLFLATVLSTSMLVFGFGAAALLRATHQEFASLPLQPTPEMAFARPSDGTSPTLALLKVDPPTTDSSVTVSPSIPDAATIEPPAQPLPPADTAAPEQVASLSAGTDNHPVAEGQSNLPESGAPDAIQSAAPTAPNSAVQSPSSPASSSTPIDASTPPAISAPANPAEAGSTAHTDDAATPGASGSTETATIGSAQSPSAATPPSEAKPVSQIAVEPQPASQPKADDQKSAESGPSDANATSEPARPDPASVAKAVSQPVIPPATAAAADTGSAGTKGDDTRAETRTADASNGDTAPATSPEIAITPVATPQKSSATNDPTTRDTEQSAPTSAAAPITIAALHIPLPVERPKTADRVRVAVKKPTHEGRAVKRPLRRVRLTQPVQQQPANPFAASPFGD